MIRQYRACFSYTLLEDGRIYVFELNTASSVRDAAFGGRFYLIKSDRKFEYMHLV